MNGGFLLIWHVFSNDDGNMEVSYICSKKINPLVYSIIFWWRRHHKEKYKINLNLIMHVLWYRHNNPLAWRCKYYCAFDKFKAILIGHVQELQRWEGPNAKTRLFGDWHVMRLSIFQPIMLMQWNEMEVHQQAFKPQSWAW